MTEREPMSENVLSRRLAAGARRMRLNDGLELAGKAGVLALAAMVLLAFFQRLLFLGAPLDWPVLATFNLPGWIWSCMLALLAVPAAAVGLGYALSGRGSFSAALI